MKDIIRALESIKEQGSFFSKRTTSLDNFSLEIKDVGVLKFPLSVTKVKSLIKLAKPAKFGWRDQTLLDKTVRDAWEISKNKIKIASNSWNKELKEVLKFFKNDLGLPETTQLKASLHNLLIYEPGQFFEYHQDSEKLEGMVGSLVILLPSSHTGGSLIIDHHGVKKQFKTAQFALDKLTYIAFYADCHHEVKAIKDGYRVALTYNLVLETQLTKVSVSNNTQTHPELAHSLALYFSEKNDVNDAKKLQRLVCLLDHSYTEKGLSWNYLKNVDRLRASALKEIAHALDLCIYLTLVDVHETWDCEGDYDNYRYDRRYRHYHDEDDDHNKNDIQVNDLIDSDTMIIHWLDAKNNPLNYKSCYLSDTQICWTKSTDQFDPFDSQHEGWMGNYGNTMDRWYHRAAIVLWKKSDHYFVLFEMDPSGLVNELLKLIKNKSQKSLVHGMIHSLLPYWPLRMPRITELSDLSKVLNLATLVSDPVLAYEMIKNFEINLISTETTRLLLNLSNQYGIEWCLSIFQEWAKPKKYSSIIKFENISKIVEDLSEHKHKNKALTDWLLSYQFENFKEYSELSKNQDTRAKIIKKTDQRIKEIIDFIKACIIVDNTKIYKKIIAYMINTIELYPALDLINVLHSLKNMLNIHNMEKWEYKKLFDFIISTLKNEYDIGLRQQNDLSIKETPSCTCQDCIILRDFLLSSTDKSKIWPLAESRRAHIHSEIDGLAIPVVHETERKGSPYRLILTKTDELYEKAEKRFLKIKEELHNCKHSVKYIY